MQRRGSLKESASSRIRVAVRVRPPDYKIPKDESRSPCVAPSATAANVVEYRHDAQAKTFTFDHVFGSDASQDDVYTSALQPLMAQFLDGFNVTVMAYGQTGSGKTHTMGNRSSVFNTTPTMSPCRDRTSSLPTPVIAPPESRCYKGASEDGLMPRFLHDLFVNLKKEPSLRTIRVTFVEIYCDTIRDLLDDRADKTLTIREDSHNVWVENVRSMQVESLPKALELLNMGRARQTIGANALNDESSRSHAVYTMEVTRKFQSEVKKSKVTFVDLAGSERIKKTQVEGVRKRESIQINMGLSALGNVINALADERMIQRRSSHDASAGRPSSPDGSHIPYRSSKLTRLLRDGLGGNARTLFIACVSPLDSNADETFITLQFANRARNIQNKAEKNTHHEALVVPVNPFEMKISRLRDEIDRLKLHILELEVSASKKDEETATTQRHRLERKEQKMLDRRDSSMTTEINIFPRLDAETQVEGECTEEQSNAFVDAATMTDAQPEPTVVAKPDLADAESQIGPSFSTSCDAEVMTDAEACHVTVDAWTEPAANISSQTDIAIQTGATFLQLNDVGTTTTEPEPVVEARDANTECEPLPDVVDTACQSDMSCSRVEEVGVSTDPAPVVETSDVETATEPESTTKTCNVFTECESLEVVDVASQSDASSLRMDDSSVSTDPDPIVGMSDVSTEYVAFSGIDAASQSDVPSTRMEDAGTSTDPETTGTLSDALCESTLDDTDSQEVASPLVSADLCMTTDAEAKAVAVDASTEYVGTCVVDSAAQPDVSSFQCVHVSTDAGPGVDMVDVETEPIGLCTTTTASQSDAKDVAVATEPESVVLTTDASTDCEFDLRIDETETTISIGMEPEHLSEVGQVHETKNVSTDAVVLFLVDAATQADSLLPSSSIADDQERIVGTEECVGSTALPPYNSGVPVNEMAVQMKTQIPLGAMAEPEQACPATVSSPELRAGYGKHWRPEEAVISPEFTFATKEEEMSLDVWSNAPLVPVSFAPCARRPTLHLHDTSSIEPPPASLTAIHINRVLSNHDISVSTFDSTTTTSLNAGSRKKSTIDRRGRELMQSLQSDPSAQSYKGELVVFAAREELPRVDHVEVFQASATSKVALPEVQDHEPLTKASLHLSENQLEVGTSELCAFMCIPTDEAEFGDFVATTRGITHAEFAPFTYCSPADEVDAASQDEGSQYHHHDNTRDDTGEPLPPALAVTVKIDPFQSGESSPHDDGSRVQADFVVVRSPRRVGSDNQQLSPRGFALKRGAAPPNAVLRPLCMFAFDDDIVMAASDKTAAQAKALYEGIREVVRDEFGQVSRGSDDDDDDKQKQPAAPQSPHSAVNRLLSETEQFIQRRRRRQQRITQLRRRVAILEDALHVESRAPISEPELQAYSMRVQEEFLRQLVQQLRALAAQRLHARLSARLEAEKSMLLPTGISSDDSDPGSPFLSIVQCEACAEWFFHRTDDVACFDRQILPLVTSGWLSLAPDDLDAEQQWFQL